MIIYIIFCTLPFALLPQELESKHHSSELRAWSPGCAVPESVGARVPPHGMGPQMVSTESVCLSGHCMWCSCGHGHGQTIRYDEDTYILYTNIHTYIQTYRHTNIQTYKHTNKHTYIHTDIQTDKHTDRQTNIQTYKQTYLPTYLPTYIHTYIHHIHTTNHKNQDWPPITNAPNAPPPQATGGGGIAKKQDWPIGWAGRRCTKCVYIYIYMDWTVTKLWRGQLDTHCLHFQCCVKAVLGRAFKRTAILASASGKCWVATLMLGGPGAYGPFRNFWSMAVFLKNPVLKETHISIIKDEVYEFRFIRNFLKLFPIISFFFFGGLAMIKHHFPAMKRMLWVWRVIKHAMNLVIVVFGWPKKSGPIHPSTLGLMRDQNLLWKLGNFW